MQSRPKTSLGRNDRHSHTGAALLLLVFMIAITLTAFTFQYFDAQSGKLAQQDATAIALAEAKTALIGAALADASIPGRLPCPEDTSKIGTALEGDALASCNTAALRIGRLPWRTLGLGKLVDGHGEPLWYVLSSGFRAAPINSETIPQLSVDGVANAAVAIIFSAGPALSGQSRPVLTSGSPPLQANYLDQGNADTDATFFKAVANAGFNDQSITISHADLFEPLEKRVLGEIRNNAAVYKDSWHAYPFPVDFSNPAALADTAFVGDITQTAGLLPVSDPAVTPNISITTLTFSGSALLGTASAISCNRTNAGLSSDKVECQATLTPGTFGFYISTGTAQFGFSNVGKGFISFPSLIKEDFENTSTTPPYIRVTSSSYTVTPTTLDAGVDASANGIIRVRFSVIGLTSSSTTLRISIGVNDYPESPATWTEDSTSWLIENDWHRVMYYKVADPYKPSGNFVTPACSGNCLSVRRTFANGSTQTTADIPGVIMTAGKLLSSTDFQATPGQARPSSLLKEYFDSTYNEQAETTLIFDQILPLKTTFNDQISTLQP
jgi:hypothetical protein